MTTQIGFTGLTTTIGVACGDYDYDCTTDTVETTLPSTTRVTGRTGHQFLTVHVWDEVGCATDNIVRLYNEGECVFKDGFYYWSKVDRNVDEPGATANWSDGETLCQVLGSTAISEPGIILHNWEDADNTVTGILSGRTAEYGGWNLTETTATVPKSGRYSIMVRGKYSKGTSDEKGDDLIRAGLTVNGVPDGRYSTVSMGRDFSGTADGANTEFKPDFITLNKGDTIGAYVSDFSATTPILVGAMYHLQWVSY